MGRQVQSQMDMGHVKTNFLDIYEPYSTIQIYPRDSLGFLDRGLCLWGLVAHWLGLWFGLRFGAPGVSAGWPGTEAAAGWSKVGVAKEFGIRFKGFDLNY